MFITINRKVHGDKTLVTTLNTEEISIPVISEQVQEPKCLYDGEGNLVEEKQPTEKLFKVVVLFKANGFHVDYLIGETEYNDLIKKLATK